jgi:hypothetical protein
MDRGNSGSDIDFANHNSTLSTDKTIALFWNVESMVKQFYRASGLVSFCIVHVKTISIFIFILR